MSHYEERLERDLTEIREQVRALSSAAQTALENSLASLLQGDRELAYYTVIKDSHVNVMMRDVDATCHRFIARHLPSAGHLRLISGVMRSTILLERIGDYAVIIAREGVQLSAPPAGAMARHLEVTMDTATRMLNLSLDAFNEASEDKARAAMDLGSSMEGIMDHVYSDLIAATEPSQVQDSLALFVVFNHVKRVADVAKNICEETLFVTTGETKAGRVHDVLFVDADGALLGPLACAIARRAHPDVARFSCAGLEPVANVDPGLVRFLEERGHDAAELVPTRLDPASDAVAKFFVVVTLDAPVERYISQVPFHTSAFHWRLDALPHANGAASSTEHYEGLYRELSSMVGDLVEMLSGRKVG